MSFSINTNITSLQAQNNLTTSANFQAKTINEVTSGLRIVNSGDDAAGLAIANALHSDQAVLTQGIQNANNGLATLQTIDGGINNVTTLLDRASTLAAQSASGTFTGSRTTLNSEFQSVVSEISQEAQSIGLNGGGQFTKALSVFVGGGAAGNGVTAVANGSVNIDLSKSAVDAASLGLTGTTATGTAGSDIGNSGATTVANILSDTANQTVAGTQNASTSFVLTGAGFSDGNAQTLNVNLTNVTNTASLLTAINAAITLATTTNSGSTTGSPLANAGITASLTTDNTGKQQLTFSSATAAFQVAAGDQTANALLGNFNTDATISTNPATGQSISSSVTGGTLGTTAAATVLRVQGSGLTGPVDFSLSTGSTSAATLAALQSTTTTSGKALAAAGITVAITGGKLAFTSATGGSINVSTSGDTTNELGFGTFTSAATAATGVVGFDSVNGTTAGVDGITGAVETAIGGTGPVAGQTLQISVAGGTAINISTGSLTTAQNATALSTGTQVALALNAAIAKSASLTSAGLVVTSDATTGALNIASNNGTAFRLNATSLDDTGVAATTATDFGFGTGGVATAAASTSNVIATNSRIDSAGASSTNTFVFNPTADQTISFSANDASGAAHTTAINLENNTSSAGATQNALSLDATIASINAQLQGSGDQTLNQIFAVKDTIVGGTAKDPVDTQGIKFVSSLSTFNVTLGASGSSTSAQGVGTAADQSTTQVSSTGSQADISTQAGAEAAVALLGTAVAKLGVAQASVGKGENDLNYAVALATSQNTNDAAAESNIRDANLAAEAANLSKAQILVQAGTAALAQANSAPQAILSLLK